MECYEKCTNGIAMFSSRSLTPSF